MSSSDTWDAFSRRLFDQNAFAIKLGLDGIRRAFALLGHPERACPAIVVGGTNGKGSVASALSAVLTEHGLRVGLYTSPHLIELRERFRIAGRPVDRDTTLKFGAAVMERFSDPAAEPCLTFFELTTVLGALIFADAAVDVVVWEVGLGGRLDAVNAIEPRLTVVTNIDLDHQQYLGDSIASIAAEKAGLRRPGVRLVLAPQTYATEVDPVFDFPETTRVDTAGTSDAENRATAIEAARAYLGTDFDPDHARAGLERWRWPGRLDVRHVGDTRFLLDAAHNVGGTRRLYDVLRADPPDACVIGAMADKDLRGMFAPLAELGVPVYLVDIDSSRAATQEQLRLVVPAELVRDYGPAARMFSAAAQAGHVAVFGSVYLLGEWFEWAGYTADELVTVS